MDSSYEMDKIFMGRWKIVNLLSNNLNKIKKTVLTQQKKARNY